MDSLGFSDVFRFVRLLSEGLVGYQPEVRRLISAAILLYYLWQHSFYKKVVLVHNKGQYQYILLTVLEIWDFINDGHLHNVPLRLLWLLGRNPAWPLKDPSVLMRNFYTSTLLQDCHATHCDSGVLNINEGSGPFRCPTTSVSQLTQGQ